jgi:hypothetical protein
MYFLFILQKCLCGTPRCFHPMHSTVLIIAILLCALYMITSPKTWLDTNSF